MVMLRGGAGGEREEGEREGEKTEAGIKTKSDEGKKKKHTHFKAVSHECLA